MTLINKIGLIGLLGVVALIVIYLIRPNYQQKTVSSTYVWKLSLKKKKKKVPVSKIRNLLLFLCQMLALTCLAMVLMKPAIVLKTPSEISEAILIIDTSASMRTKSAETETTRFERAVTQADEQAKQVLRGGGTLSVALAGDDTDFLFKQISGAGAAATVSEALKGLDMQNFGYGSADIDGALKECEDILYGNPDAMIYVYTDASYYTTPNGIQVVNVAEEGEWNAAILDARAVWDDGYYSFTVQGACYGKDARLSLNMRVYGVNGEAGKSLNYTVAADCNDNETTTLIFRYRKDGEAADTNVKNQQVFDLGNLGGSDQTKINSFSSVHLSFSGDMEDCYALDDNFDVFGGQKQTLKVQYASAEPNPFVNGVKRFCGLLGYSADGSEKRRSGGDARVRPLHFRTDDARKNAHGRRGVFAGSRNVAGKLRLYEKFRSGAFAHEREVSVALRRYGTRRDEERRPELYPRQPLSGDFELRRKLSGIDVFEQATDADGAKRYAGRRADAGDELFVRLFEPRHSARILSSDEKFV